MAATTSSESPEPAGLSTSELANADDASATEVNVAPTRMAMLNAFQLESNILPILSKKY